MWIIVRRFFTAALLAVSLAPYAFAQTTTTTWSQAVASSTVANLPLTSADCIGLSQGLTMRCLNQLLLGGQFQTFGAVSIANLGTANNILYTSSAGNVSPLATANNSVLVTNGSGVPSISSTLPSAVQSNMTGLGIVTSGAISGITGITNTPISGSTGAFTAETLTGAITSTQTVSSLPSDLSKVNYVATQNVSSTLGAPGTFTVIDKAAINHQIFNQLGGYNGDTGDGTKSTGVFANYTSIVTNSATLGASGAYWISGTLYGAMPGATDFLANPSIQSITGQFNAGQAGVFLQGIGDIDLVDNGFVAAGIGEVIGLDRTVVAGSPSLGTTWEGVSIQSFGSKEIDASYHATGPTRIGLDLTGISNPNGTTPVAIAMSAAWGIYGNATFSASGSGTDCTTQAVNSGRANCVNPGTDFISDTAPGWQFVVSGSTQLQLNGSNIIMNAAPSFAGSTTGASTPSYTNSPCTGGTVRWIPALAAGQTGVWYIPLCK